jgi:hypothetical protein
VFPRTFRKVTKLKQIYMKKQLLQGKVKSVKTTYLMWFFGFQYAYLGQIGMQILYFFTLGGFGLWCLIDLFTLSGRVERLNAKIYSEIEDIENREKDDAQARNIAMIKAATS